MLVYGGDWDYANYRGDLWALSLGGAPSWTQLMPGELGPGRRTGVASALDAERDRWMLFAGRIEVEDRDLVDRDDPYAVHLAAPSAWAVLPTTGERPYLREFPGAIVDPFGDRLLVFGGYEDGYRADVWTMDLRSPMPWSEASTVGGSPEGRIEAAVVYDPFRHRMLVFGGRNPERRLDDLWELTLPAPTPVQASVAATSAQHDRVTVTWQLAGDGATAVRIGRHAGDQDWTPVAAAAPDGDGRVTYVDAAVVPGERYGYRVGIPGGEDPMPQSEAWVEVPRAPTLALAPPRPNPSRPDAVWVSYRLASATPATLELFDPAGRAIRRLDCPRAAGTHEANLARDGRLPMGVYFLRLRQGDAIATARLAVVE
jgi:hypothetical protein